MELSYQISLITIYTLLFEILVVNCNTLPRCSAKDNTYWKESKQRCTPCRTCPAGTARNLSSEIELKTGPNGDEECFPCQECPNDHYVYISNLEFIPPYCTPCSADCASRNRYMKKACSSLSNFECGDCLSGYENKYGNSDFPCTRKTSFTLLPETAVKSSTEISSSVTNPANTSALVRSSQPEKKSGGGFTSLPVALQVLIIILPVISVFVIAVIFGTLTYNRYCPQKSASTETLGTIPSEYSWLSTEDEIDGGGDNEERKTVTGECHCFPDIPQTLVRGELPNSESIPPEQIALLADALKSFNRTTSTSVCHCSTFPVIDCSSCVQLLAKQNCRIGNNTDLISFIASEVCHDPLQLFRALGVPDSEVYHLNDDRIRAPEKISQKDFIYNVLHRWLQVKPEATYHDLFTGLCRGGFHRINIAVFAQYDSYVPQV